MGSWTGSLRPTTSTDRLLAYVTLLTAVVASLAVAAADASLFIVQGPVSATLAEEASGPAPVATRGVLGAFVLAVTGLYVLIPTAVATYRARYGDRHWLAPVAWAAVAVFGLPWLGYVLSRATAPFPDRRVRGLAALVVGPALVVLALRVAAWRDDEDGPGEPTDDRPKSTRPDPPVAAFLNLGLLAVLLVGAVGGSVLAAAVDDHVRDQHPSATFDYDYRATGEGRGVLTITHDGGPSFDARRVTVEGSGFAEVPGANQTAPGPWRGSTTGTAASGQPAVGPGDSVTVGVDAGDCAVRVEYANYTVGEVHPCSDASVRGPERFTDDPHLAEGPTTGDDR